MKKTFFLIFTLLCNLSASAADWFPFREVNHKWNISINGGYSPSGRAFLAGIGVTVRGFHLTIGGKGSSHEHDWPFSNCKDYRPITDLPVGGCGGYMHDRSFNKWKEPASFMFQFGYQIPIVKSLRIIPVAGTLGIGEVITDGSDWEISDSGVITNEVTIDLKYKFDYGAHIVFNRRKLIINIGVTRHTLLGGIGLEF